MPRRALLVLTLVVGLAVPAASGLASPAQAFSVLSAPDSSTPVSVAVSSVRPPGRRLSSEQALAIAARLPAMRRLVRQHPGAFADPYFKGSDRWQVSYFSAKGNKEIGQVLIADATGKVLEEWTGFQVAWTMARGYPGAFGRSVNALYVWIPLSVLFVLPFVQWRRLRCWWHLDLAMLSFFSVSLAFFNHADIGMSVPLNYIPLTYLLVRMLVVARAGRRGAPRDRPPLRSWVPPYWLAVGVVFLVGFRVALNVVDSNVIDVGYAGVIGAHRIVHGESLYGHWPADNPHGDTYGPVSYESYIPFVAIFGWSGKWDDLPAAHAASIVFDLLALVLLFLIGNRVRGPDLGVMLAWAWVSFPFTLYSLESNTNDSLVAVLVLGAILLSTRASARGVLAALAGLSKFAPLALAPLLATEGMQRMTTRQRLRTLAAFTLAFAVTAAIVSIPAFTHSSLHTLYERTFVYQANRGSPFSVWGLYGGLRIEQATAEVLAVVLAIALAVIPRRRDVAGLAAAAAAIMLATQLGVDHWFYLYIPWFFPLVMLALLGRGAVAQPGWVSQPPGVASEPARSPALVVA